MIFSHLYPVFIDFRINTTWMVKFVLNLIPCPGSSFAYNTYIGTIHIHPNLYVLDILYQVYYDFISQVNTYWFFFQPKCIQILGYLH